METDFTQVLLNVLAILGIVLCASFLLFGMVKGLLSERDWRIKNRGRYS